MRRIVFFFLSVLAFVALMPPPAAAQLGPYLGCFRDQGEPSGTRGRDLDGHVKADARMTGQMCAAECAARGFPYAATQFSNYCFCGNSYGRSGPANNCDMPCAGNPGERCGGGWANSVYAVQRAAPPVVVQGGYLGCFRDQGEAQGTRGRDLDGFIKADARMTSQMCRAECAQRGFAYAGTQFSNYCFCGNSYGRSGPASNCDMACAGNPGERCGGGWANSVYATGAAAGAGQPLPGVVAQPPVAPPPPGGVSGAGVAYPAPRVAGMQVDWCPTFGANCGQAGADLFCRAQGHTRALQWQWGYTDSTWVIGSGQVCAGGRCGGLRDVVCAPLR